MRNPVITSSKIRSAPSRLVMSRSPSRKPVAGGTTPIFAATGSTMIAAIFPRMLAKNVSTLPKSLYGAFSVSRASASGTPGQAAMPSVARPEPASERKLSAWPW